MSALVHGHAHPRLVAAIISAAEQGSSMGLPTESELDLATLLTERIGPLDMVRFTNSGTEAVIAALRLARAYTGRDAILRFEGCYHGTYDPILPTSSPGVPAAMERTVVTVPYGDISAFDKAIRRRSSDLAAVIVDLMPNRVGLGPAPLEFAKTLRDLTRQLGVLLIVDEVITFRLEYGGLEAAYELEPDLITLGKAIGGGLPIGAFGGRRDIMAMFDPRGPQPLEHGGTFTANPVVMRAGIAALELLNRSEVARINGLGDLLRSRLVEIGYRVNGRGSLCRVLSPDPTPLWWDLYRAGVLIGKGGLMCVSTPVTEQTVDDVVKRFVEIDRPG